MIIDKEYIGDAVYVEFDGYHVLLTVSDGIKDTDTIALEPSVMQNLSSWLKRLKDAMKAEYEPITEDENGAS